MQHILSYVVIAIFGLLFVGTDPVLAAGTEDTAVNTDTGAEAYAQAKAAIYVKDYAAALPILAKLTTDEPGNADAWKIGRASCREIV